METMAWRQQAKENLTRRLAQNRYPGRGIILGLNSGGTHWIQVYWIMGRSANSRNRIFKLENERVMTYPKDATKVVDPSLIIYNALRHTQNQFMVTNGAQTDTILDALEHNGSLETALLTHTYEPDAPNFTPRISGLIDLTNEKTPVQLTIIKKSPWGENAEYQFFKYPSVENGLGLCLHTYQNDGDPLPGFSGEPYLVPLAETAQEIANQFWHSLDNENKISLVVKAIQVNSRKISYEIINRY
jgi:hypothetical protein